MSKFTKGPWLTQEENNNAIHFWSIQSKNGEQIGDCLMEANARLIAAAPEMYEMLKEELIPASDYGGILSFERERKVRELLARINGEEERHD